MNPASPVIADYKEVVYAKDQPEYIPLPAIRTADGTVITRWRLSWRERLRVLLHGEVYLTVLTFNHPLQPVRLEVSTPMDVLEGTR